MRKKEKIYFYDWSELENPGKRFENLALSIFDPSLFTEREKNVHLCSAIRFLSALV